ncbi:MAG: lysine biosynthesis protein LysW [Phycisphaerales bacterium]
MSTPTPTQSACTSSCPECESTVRFDRAPLQGQVVRCTDCGVELEVTNASPITLELAPEVEEDWGE